MRRYFHLKRFAFPAQLARVWQLLWTTSPYLTIAFPLLSLAAGPLPALQLYCFKKILDGVGLWIASDIGTGRRLVFAFLALYFACGFLRRLLASLIQYLSEILNPRLANNIQMMISAHAMSLDLAFYEDAVFYDKLRRSNEDAAFRPYAIVSSLVNGALDFCTFCSYIAVVATLSWWVVPYLLAITVPGLLVRARFGRMGWVILRGRTHQERRMSYYSYLTTSGHEAQEIRLFGLSHYLLDQWNRLFESFYRQDQTLAAKRNAAQFGAAALALAGGMGYYAFCVYYAITEPSTVTIGSLVMYLSALDGTTECISNIFRSLTSLYENNLYLCSLFEFLDLKPAITAPAQPACVPERIAQGIRFENVSFRYPGSEADAVCGLTVEIHAGERIALVGENGAGKTTLVKLLARLYDPQAGRIVVDGVDIRDFDPTEWHRHIGFVFQDFAEYCATVSENIGFGKVGDLHNMERMRDAAMRSGADKCLARFQNGYNTMLGKMFEDGEDLSVGEWQRIALARAFMRDAQLLVLDEPTASLDAKQEHELSTQFHTLTRGKTTILISHRLSTVRMADRIFVIEKGRIVETGTHDTLMAARGLYAALFARQSHAYQNPLCQDD